MDGPAPLGYSTIAAWSRLVEVELQPFEVEALVMLDTALRHPEEPEEQAEVAPMAATPAWPSRRTEPAPAA